MCVEDWHFNAQWDALMCMQAYIFLIDCLLVALDAHMLSHNGYGPGTTDQGPKAGNIWASGAINSQSVAIYI